MEFVGESGREGGEVCFGGYSWRHGEFLFEKKMRRVRLAADMPLLRWFMMKLL